MADLALADISAALSLVHREKIVNSINRNVVLTQLIPIVQGSGKVCSWTVKFTGRATGAGFTEGADMGASDFDQERRVQASLSWAQYRKGAKVTGLAAAGHASSVNPQSAAEVGGEDIMLDEISDGTKQLALGLAEDTFAGTGGASDPLIGLDTAVAATGTYAGINQATYAEWASTVQTDAIGALSEARLRTYHDAIYEACGSLPEFCVVPTALYAQIGALFSDRKRHIVDVINTQASGEIKLKGGFAAIEVDGIPYVRDRHATANIVYALNSQFIEYEELPAYNSPLSFEEFAAIYETLMGDRPSMAAFGEMDARNGGLRPYVEFLSKTGDAQKAMVKTYLALKVKRRNGLGRLVFS